jgi:hypothetical protein
LGGKKFPKIGQELSSDEHPRLLLPPTEKE